VAASYPIAGSLVDLVAEKDGRAFGVDLIGTPDEIGSAVDLERYRMLARAGLSLFPLPLSSWERDLDACRKAFERHWKAVASGVSGN
jgi:hypothetical protein